MDKEPELIEDDGYIGIKFSEYKELLIIKGRYEELSKPKTVTIDWDKHLIEPLKTPLEEACMWAIKGITREEI